MRRVSLDFCLHRVPPKRHLFLPLVHQKRKFSFAKCLSFQFQYKYKYTSSVMRFLSWISGAGSVGVLVAFGTAAATGNVILAASIPIEDSTSASSSMSIGHATQQRALNSTQSSMNDGLSSVVFAGGGLGAIKKHLSETETDDVRHAICDVGLSGASPVMIAAFHGHSTEVLEYFVQQGGNLATETTSTKVATNDERLWSHYFPDYKPTPGLRPIDFAVLGGNESSVEFLIEHGATDPTKVMAPKQKQQRPQNPFITQQMPPPEESDDIPRLEALIDVSLPLRQARRGGPGAEATARRKLLDAIAKGKERRAARMRLYRQQFPLEAQLSQKLVGQLPAISSVAASIRRKENGWFDSTSPLVLLFLGSSGIGKTKTAKLVAEYLFDKDESTLKK